MERMNAKNKIEEAMQLPSPSEELIQQTSQRGRLIANGRRAGERLDQYGNQLPAQERLRLAAEWIIGRLAVSEPSVAQQDSQQMTQQLMDEPKFQQAALDPNVVGNIQNGTFLRQLTQQPEQPEQPQAAEAAKIAEQEAPQRKMPEGPVL